MEIPRAGDMYVDDYSTLLWFRVAKDKVLIIYDDFKASHESYDGTTIYDEEDICFDRAVTSGRFMVVPYNEDECFIFLNTELEIKFPKIYSKHWRYGEKEYLRYDNG